MNKLLHLLWLLLVLSGTYSYGQNLRPKILDTDNTIHAVVQSGDTVYIGGSFNKVGYHTGNLARLSANSDVPDDAFYQVVDGNVINTISDGNGGWYLGGTFTYQAGNSTRYNLVHLLANGEVDQGFDSESELNTSIHRLILSGTTLYVSGYFNQLGGQPRQYLAALDGSTGKATSWNPAPDEYVNDILLYGSKLYAVGSFFHIGGKYRHGLAALDVSTGQATHSMDLIGGANTITTDGSNLYVGGYFSHVGYYTGNAAKLTTSSDVPEHDFHEALQGAVNTVIPDGSGGWYLGGTFTYSVNGEKRKRLAHILSDGTFDAHFNPAPNNAVQQVLLSGSTLYATGTFTEIGGQARQHLAALDAATGQATNWNPAPNGKVADMLLSGRLLYLGGSFTQVGGASRNFLAAVEASTGYAASWNPQPNGSVQSLALDNGILYVGGYFTQIGAQYRSFLAAVDIATGQATAWNLQANSPVQRVLLSGNTLYAAGSFTEIGGHLRQYLAAVDASTGQVTPFNPRPNGNVQALALGDEKLFVGGSFTNIGGQNRKNLAALHTSNGAVSTWAPEPNQPVYTLAVSGSDILVGGSFYYMKAQQRQNLAALNIETGEIANWNPQSNGQVDKLLLSGSTLYTAGNFTQVGGLPRQRLAALDVSTGQAKSFNPELEGYLYTMAISGTTLYIGGDFSRVGGESRKNLASLNISTGQATSWAPDPDDVVLSVMVEGSDVMAGGFFHFLKAHERQKLAAFRASTGELLPWNPGANSTVGALAVHGATLFVGGQFTELGGQQRARVGAVNRATGEVTSWNPGADRAVEVLAVDGAVLYAGGQFTHIGGQSRNALAALELASNAATPWNPSVSGSVHALAVNGTTIYAGGTFSRVGNQERSNIAAFDKPSGNLTAWNPATNGTVHALALDGPLLYTGGSFTQAGGQPRNHAVALRLDNGVATSWNPNLSHPVLTLTKYQQHIFSGGQFTRAGDLEANYIALLDAVTGSVIEGLPLFNNAVNTLHYNPASATLYAGGQFTRSGHKYRHKFASLDVKPSAVSSQVITFNAIEDKTMADDPITLTATASSGLPVTFSLVSGPANLSGDQVTFTGTGTVTVRASQAGNEHFSPAPDVEQTFHVTKASQTLDFAAVSDKTLGDPDFVLAATASSGLPVKFEVVSGPATISGNVVSLTGTGTVAIEATQEGNEEYEVAGAVLRTFVVSAPVPAIQLISFQDIPDIAYTEEPILLHAIATSGLPVTFEVVSGPATVAGNTLIVTGTGNVTVSALQPGNSAYAPAPPMEQTFTVEKATQVLTFYGIPNTAPTLEPIPVSAHSSSGLPVSFRIKSGPATIEGNLIKITGSGAPIVVEASQEGDANYHAAEPVEQSFYVLPGPKENQYLMVVVRDMAYRSHPFPVMAEASSGLPVELEILSGPATISGKYVTLTGTGTVVVKASQAGNFYYSSKSTERSFNVYKATQTLIFPLLPNMTFGDGPFVLETTASSGLPVTWEVVSGPATMSGNILTLTGAGTVTVRATQEGNENYLAAAPWEYSFEVEKAPQTISFAPIPAKALGDEPFMLSATSSSGLPVNFSLVSGPATVSGNTVALTGAGTVVVRAQQEGDVNYRAATPVEQRFEVRAGGIFWEYYMNPPAWADLPSGKPIPADYKPTGSRILPSFASPLNFGNKYSSRARGYVIAPVSGEYVFYLASDDKGELWLSSDETPSNKQLIAHVTGHTAPLQYDKYWFQTSKAVYLRAGQRYYIEALHREKMGVDHLSVGWTMPGGAKEQVISGQYLEPYVPEMANLTARSTALTKAASEPDASEVHEEPLLAYPNPFSSEMTVAFTLEEAEERVVVEILTVHGQLLETLHNGKAEPGVRYTYTFNGERYSTGVYLCRMIYKDRYIYKRIVLAR